MGFGIVHIIVQYGLGILIIAMIVRAILSWVRVDEQRYAFTRFLVNITDPFILPFRRFIPPVGIFDMAFIVAFFLLYTLQALLLQALPPGW